MSIEATNVTKTLLRKGSSQALAHTILKALTLVALLGAIVNWGVATYLLRPIFFDGGRLTFMMVNSATCSWENVQSRFFSCAFQYPAIWYTRLIEDFSPKLAAWIFFGSLALFFSTTIAVLAARSKKIEDDVLIASALVISLYPASVFYINSANETICLALIYYFIWNWYENSESRWPVGLLILVAAVLAFGHQSALYVFLLLATLSLWHQKKTLPLLINLLGAGICFTRIKIGAAGDPAAFQGTRDDVIRIINGVLHLERFSITSSILVLLFVCTSFFLVRRKLLFYVSAAILIAYSLRPANLVSWRLTSGAYAYRTVAVPIVCLLLFKNWIEKRRPSILGINDSLVIGIVLLSVHFANVYSDLKLNDATRLANSTIEGFSRSATKGCAYYDGAQRSPATLYHASIPFAAIFLSDSLDVNHLIYERKYDYRGEYVENFDPCRNLNPDAIQYGYDSARGYWGASTALPPGSPLTKGNFRLNYLISEKQNLKK